MFTVQISLIKKKTEIWMGLNSAMGFLEEESYSFQSNFLANKKNGNTYNKAVYINTSSTQQTVQ